MMSTEGISCPRVTRALEKECSSRPFFVTFPPVTCQLTFSWSNPLKVGINQWFPSPSDEKGAAGMDLTMQERKKLTMVKAQAYLKAGKAKRSAMLDDFCESTGYCRRHVSVCGEPHSTWASPCG